MREIISEQRSAAAVPVQLLELVCALFATKNVGFRKTRKRGRTKRSITSSSASLDRISPIPNNNLLKSCEKLCFLVEFDWEHSFLQLFRELAIWNRTD